MSKPSAVQAELLLVLVTLLWGGTFLLTKNALDEVPPFAFTAIRFGIALVVILALFAGRLRALSRRETAQGVWLGVLYGIGFAVQTIGLQYTTVARSSFITGSLVVMVPFAYWLIERRRITLFQKGGVFIAAVGLWIFTNPSGGEINVGDILTFISAMCWALYVCYLDKAAVVLPADGAFNLTVRLVTLQFAVTFFIGMLGWVALETFSFRVNTNVVTALLYSSLFASVIATLLQTHFQNRTTPVKAALIFALEPIFASAIMVIATGVQLQTKELIGGFLIVAGVLVGETGDMVFAKRAEKDMV
jgi:drug/metabolite transporter (DMT)-like permease